MAATSNGGTAGNQPIGSELMARATGAHDDAVQRDLHGARRDIAHATAPLVDEVHKKLCWAAAVEHAVFAMAEHLAEDHPAFGYLAGFGQPLPEWAAATVAGAQNPDFAQAVNNRVDEIIRRRREVSDRLMAEEMCTEGRYVDV